MQCLKCHDIEQIDKDAAPYLLRQCDGCGREIAFRRPGKHGIGISVNAGEKFVIPSAWLQLSANPLKGHGYLTRSGVDFFAKSVFTSNIGTRRDDFDKYLEEIVDNNDVALESIANSFNLSLNDGDALFEKLRADTSNPAWWLFLSQITLQGVIEYGEKGDAYRAAWAAMVSERARAIHTFMEHFADAVFMGNTSRRLIDLIHIWDNNKTNSDEEFWQITFQNYPLALAQLFSSAVTFLEGKAYVGGHRVDNKNAKFVDFLFSGGSGRDAVLVEIKTPTTRFLHKRQYRRGVHATTSEINGAIGQILDYRNTLLSEIDQIKKGTRHEFQAINPRSIVIAGNSAELDTDDKRVSFENFRRNSSGVEIVTFDEVFEKIKYLISIFGLEVSASSARDLRSD
ncbi:DUF4263 domain-containing protein [Arsenicitalea aurantiaca]|uniref:DUF4263 domain-containing protein n=1 Tax=Arsenicitalea aurantiaca TaxID=1783274 RepID=A0A433XGB6_9HYPH|nr:Shedu immune nuclease family protein [Arsenicitalea aurantiaca]RUT33157.1 DUF4263 domain-containing protein [Arsenicitalea aurantiaca]